MLFTIITLWQSIGAATYRLYFQKIISIQQPWLIYDPMPIICCRSILMARSLRNSILGTLVISKLTSHQFPIQTRRNKQMHWRQYIQLKIILKILAGGQSRSDIRRESLPRYYEELSQKLPELMDVLDCSKDSIWFAIYMIEEGAPGCPLAVNSFEKHFEQCS